MRPFSICLSTASRFSFILIFLPEMAERGAPESEEDEEASLSLPLPLLGLRARAMLMAPLSRSLVCGDGGREGVVDSDESSLA